jgi:protein fantom
MTVVDEESEFGPGENLLEVWIVDATLDPAKVDPHALTFVMCDFYDYETQTTPLLSGLTPAFNFSATFKVEVDHFFLRFLSSESLTLELNRARHADFELLGQVTVPLHALLEATGRFTLASAPVLSPVDGSVVGTMQLDVRLAVPVDQLFDIYLRDNPGEAARLQRLRSAQREAAEEELATTRASNTLEVAIVSATDLRTAHGAPPSAYVQYKLLGFPDVFTRAVEDNGDPVFNSSQPFPLTVDNRLLRLLRRERLELSVFDDNDRDSSDQGNNGILGVALVPLAALAEGDPVDGVFAVESFGQKVGSLRVSCRWLSPLQPGGSEGARSNVLTRSQIESLMSRFDTEANGSVDYHRFLRFVSPDDAVRSVELRLRQKLARARHRGKDHKDAFNHMGRPGSPMVSEVRTFELRPLFRSLFLYVLLCYSVG